MADYKDRQYTVEMYNPEWASQFKIESDTIKSFFGNTVDIEHVGSTAVPGLGGKPTIDVLVLIQKMPIDSVIVSNMTKNGYKDMGEYIAPGSRLFVKEKNNTRLVNVHVFPRNHAHANEMLQVKDYLRSHPAKVIEYNELKNELYAKYPNDYGMYRKFKDEWMNKLVESIS